MRWRHAWWWLLASEAPISHYVCISFHFWLNVIVFDIYILFQASHFVFPALWLSHFFYPSLSPRSSIHSNTQGSKFGCLFLWWIHNHTFAHQPFGKHFAIALYVSHLCNMQVKRRICCYKSCIVYLFKCTLTAMFTVITRSMHFRLFLFTGFLSERLPLSHLNISQSPFLASTFLSDQNQSNQPLTSTFLSRHNYANHQYNLW